MPLFRDPQLLLVAAVGVVGGLVLLVRGFGGYRDAARIADTAPSRIASIAVGEVLVSGTVEPAELTLVSPLRSTTCVYYRSRIDESGEDSGSTAFREEAAVGFRVRDGSGDLRVFPREAQFDVPSRFEVRSGALGERPAGLSLRSGSAYGAGPDRESQIAALLTVKPASDGPPGLFIGTRRPQRYSEAWIEPGDIVTIVGRAMPFDQLEDPAGSNVLDGLPGVDDHEIAADLAAARAAGLLAADAEDAWGNAAIPGFGIGRPVRAPELHDEATDPPLATEADADRFRQTFEIAPDALVLAASTDVPLVIAFGAQSVAARRSQREFLVGLLGAVVAIASAMALAVMLGDGLGG